MQLMRQRLIRREDFSTSLSYYSWFLFALILVPLTLHPRLFDLANPLIQPHPWRQNQTALTAYYFAKDFGSVFDYRSPYGGKLWNYVIEFPLYQWLVAKVMSLGFSLEVAGKSLSLFFFFLGSIFLCKSVSKIFSKEAGLWAAVLYIISPFSIIYSRTVLIDPMVQCWCLISGYYSLCLVADGFKIKKYFFLSVFFGVLASTGKVTVWFSLALTAFLFLAFSLLIKKEKIITHKLLISSFLIQAVFGVSWMLWSSHILALTDSHSEPRWFFGELSQRISLWRWKRLFTTTGRNILADFMILPFLFSFMADKKTLLPRIVMLLVIFIPVLILFNIHVHHDYYFISETPYLFALVGVGIVTLFESRKKLLQISTLLIMSALFAWQIKKIDPILGILYHDYRPEIADILTLKKMTDPNDLIYYQTDEIGRYQIPLYSERKVLLGPSSYFGKFAKEAEAIKPNVFWLEHETGFEHFDSIKTLSLITEGASFYLLRSAQPDNREMNPAQLVTVTDIPEANALKLKLDTQNISSCDSKGRTYAVFQLPSDIKRIELYSPKVKNTYTLPAKSFLYLPQQTPLGCEFTVSFKK